MWDWTDSLGVILFDSALSTAVFLTFIVLAMLGCRQPARRILLARVALLASLAILPLVAIRRLPRLDLIDTFVESRFFPRSLFLEPAPVDGVVVAIEEPPPAPWKAQRTLPHWLSACAAMARSWLPRGLTFLDMACVAAGFAWVLLGLAGVHWLIYRSRPPSPATRALFDTLVAGRTGAAARTGLRVCSRLQHPVVTGLFRPTILIPEALDRVDDAPEPLRLALLHEMAHAERSDHWFNTAASLAQAVWFFLPQIWWIRSQLLIDQEFLADRSAAERYGTSSGYASSLLSLAAPGRARAGGPPRDPAPDAPAAGTIGVPSPLFQRMMMLLHCPYPVESRTPRVWSWTSRLAVVVASIVAACLVIRWPQASLAVPAPPAATSSPHRLVVSEFVARPFHEPSGADRSLVYIMRKALPAQFDLDVEVRSDEPDLSQIRIAGLPLGVLGASTVAARPLVSSAESPAGTPGGTTDWHKVRLHGEHGQVTVQVDGRVISRSSRNGSAALWLTVEPPSHASAEFRGLVVTW